MFYCLPPAGNRIRVPAARVPPPADLFAPYHCVYLASGTAALAAALQAAVRRRPASAPEVILPAYGCPDLVSAALFAGVRPVLVDLVPERPWLDLDQLEACLSPHTVAIVAVSLLGIPERMQALRAIAQRHSVLLVEDSAQAFPAGDMAGAWSGDLVVLSFGRGKPLSLLGGGAVLFRDEQFRPLLPAGSAAAPAGWRARLAVNAQARLYNALSSPRAYWLPAALPWLGLGETRFQPLESVEDMASARLELLADNLAAYRTRGMQAQSRLATISRQQATESAGRLLDLPAVCDLPEMRRLLRYPVLLPAGSRDAVFKCMKSKCLGASILYPAALPDIAGLAPYLGDGARYPVARAFASRLLTLPVHERVRAVDIAAMADCLARVR
jgi:dTDP-4-amino-4,6-dideoxygalactose transaminase